MNILELKTKSNIEEIGIFGIKVIDLNPQEKDKAIELLYDEMERYREKCFKSEREKVIL